MSNLYQSLEQIAYRLRIWSVAATTAAGSGHATSCLSAADIMAVLFFHIMRYDIQNYENSNNDRFVLSKGHASALLYAAWKEAGLLSASDMLSYRCISSPLEGHVTNRFPYTEAATGSLGIGLSIGVGIAFNALFDKRSYRTFVLLGDSELAEGSIWESVQIAAHYQLDSLVAIVDCNRLGQTTQTLFGHDTAHLEKIFASFGWNAFSVEGHDIAALVGTFDRINYQTKKPTVVIAKTTKGYGVRRAADKLGFHGISFKKEDLAEILQEIRAISNMHDNASENELINIVNQVQKTSCSPQKQKELNTKQKVGEHPSKPLSNPSYTKGEMIATRKAFGQALTALGDACSDIISLDAEVKNSTFAELFEKAHPERFIQCFIAEQNMVGMGIGLARRGKIPFISTFGAFFTRAHDQIRMAAIGVMPLRLVGSHAGISIGQDGPSQMALEDISMIRALPDSIIFYPSDAVSTYKLVERMASYRDGISYMRTTRAETPVLYDNKEKFVIGGCKIVHQPQGATALLVAAGITLHEALKASSLLASENMPVSVIDLYCVKPLDIATLLQTARASDNRILVIEDHYPAGGIGEAIQAALCNENIEIRVNAVTQLPRSGSKEDLLAWAHIDAEAIVQTVKNWQAKQ